MTGAASAVFGVGDATVTVVAPGTGLANARRSSSSCSSARGRPSASFALRTVSPILPGTRSSAAWARALTRSTPRRHTAALLRPAEPGLRSRTPIVLVDDAQALAARGDRRRGLVVRIDLGGDRDDAVLLAGL